jgi:hypothetical protein
MGNLTTYLQNAFAQHCPNGWSCKSEVLLLSKELNELFGYSSRADILLAKNDGSRRLWIEFEVSRADPVANHAKFATAHLFSRQLESDCFISMVSSHIARGRMNLAANTIHVMREAGMNAFQTLLFPDFSPDRIKLLNHLEVSAIYDQSLPVRREVERAFEISKPVLATKERRIYFASNILEVMLNLRRWNQELLTEEGRNLWGTRNIKYFVFDPITKNFAPSKFCAYIPENRIIDVSSRRTVFEMNLDLYSSLENEPSFDGNRAWTHLTKNLAMNVYASSDLSEILPFFERWLNIYAKNINIIQNEPIFILPPEWLI